MNPDEGHKEAVILAPTVVKGDMRVTGDLRLFGRVMGDVSGARRVVVMEGGVVTGGVTCGELVVEGEVGGDVEARVLEVREGASLKGRATVGRLRVAGDRFELPWLRLTGNANDLK